MLRVPPATDTWPVDIESVPTNRLDVSTKLPPARVNVPLGTLVTGSSVMESVTTVDKATKALSARTMPLETVISPLPSRPIQMLSLVSERSPPVTRTWPMELLNRAIERASSKNMCALLCTLRVPTEPTCRPTDTLVSQVVALDTVIFPGPYLPMTK